MPLVRFLQVVPVHGNLSRVVKRVERIHYPWEKRLLSQSTSRCLTDRWVHTQFLSHNSHWRVEKSQAFVGNKLHWFTGFSAMRSQTEATMTKREARQTHFGVLCSQGSHRTRPMAATILMAEADGGEEPHQQTRCSFCHPVSFTNAWHDSLWKKEPWAWLELSCHQWGGCSGRLWHRALLLPVISHP
jgi:hypothetical protein